jgi:hypothetical protein
MEVLNRRNWPTCWIVFWIGSVRYERRTFIRDLCGDTGGLFDNHAGVSLMILWQSGRWEQQAPLGRETQIEVETMLTRLFVFGVLKGLEPEKV